MSEPFSAGVTGRPAPASPFEPLTADDPVVIGGYQLQARLGAGGMGRVYLAFTPGGRALAVKVVRREFAEDAEFRGRFAQEIRAAQRVNGVYTAQVVDAGPDAEQPWLATAYVPGPSLAAAVREHGPLPPRTVLLLAAAVAESLAAIHAASVVHRDLKPANVVLAEDGPRVIDFGIARAGDSTPLTATGIRIGTPQYMAPEQALGQSAEPATDLFSLGSLAFYAATGRTPFGDGQEMAVLYRVVNEQPNLADCPPELLPVVQACLVKDPAERIAGPALIDLCRQLAGGDLRITAGWLPSAVASEATRRIVVAPAPPTHIPSPAESAATLTPAQAATAQAATQQIPWQMPAQVSTVAAAPVGPTQQSGQPGQGPGQNGPDQSATTAHWGRRLLLGALVVVLLVGAGAIAAVSLNNKNSSDTGTSTGTQNQVQGQATTPSAGSGVDLQSPSAAPNIPVTIPPTAVNPTDTTVVDNGNPPGTLLGSYHIDLPQGYGFNLTSDLTSPSTAVLNDDGVNFDVDYPTYDSFFEASTPNATLAILQSGTVGSYQNCLNDTQYVDQMNLADLSVGTEVCDITPRGRVALLQITHLPAQGDPSTYVGFNITLWQGVIAVS